MTEASSQRILARPDILEIEPLLKDILQEGRLRFSPPTIEEIRSLRQSDMDRLDPGVKRLMNPHIYHVSLTEKMWQLKQRLISSMRSGLPHKD